MKPLRYILLLCSLWVSTAALAQPDAAQFAEVDRMRDEGQFREALALLEDMQAQNPDDPGVLWRLSRTRVDVGEQAASEDEQETLYHAAVDDAERAVELAPESSDAHLALAMSAGRKALISGTRQRVELSRVVKDHADRSIDLDPAQAAAYHVRARWNYEVASVSFLERAAAKMVYGGLPRASYEQAVQDFEKAIQLDDRVVHHLELGRTYLKMDEDDKARAELTQALSMPDLDPDDPAYKAEAQQLLRKVD